MKSKDLQQYGPLAFVAILGILLYQFLFKEDKKETATEPATGGSSYNGSGSGSSGSGSTGGGSVLSGGGNSTVVNTGGTGSGSSSSGTSGTGSTGSNTSGSGSSTSGSGTTSQTGGNNSPTSGGNTIPQTGGGFPQTNPGSMGTVLVNEPTSYGPVASAKGIPAASATFSTAPANATVLHAPGSIQQNGTLVALDGNIATQNDELLRRRVSVAPLNFKGNA